MLWAILLALRLVWMAPVQIDGHPEHVWIVAEVDRSRWVVPMQGPVGYPARFRVYWLAEGQKSLLGTVDGVYTGHWTGHDDPQKLTNDALKTLGEEA